MKRELITLCIIILALPIVWFTTRQGQSIPSQENGTRRITDEYIIDPSDMYKGADEATIQTSTSTTKDEQGWLIHMREEEKLARDVYTMLGAKWGVQVFSNIASSEQTHTTAVKLLLDRYGIKDPVTDDTIGVFTLPEMQKLYTDLTAQGNKSLLDALVVGATIEDLDIRDLDNALAETKKTDIIQTYENLQKGSRNHMRAFIKNIQRQGGTYAPQYISLDAFNKIITSPQERGVIQ